MHCGVSSFKGKLAGFATKALSFESTGCLPRFVTAWACSPAAPRAPAASRPPILRTRQAFIHRYGGIFCSHGAGHAAVDP